MAVKFSDQSFKHHTLEGTTFGVDESYFPLRYRTSNDVRRFCCYVPHDDARQRFHNNFREVNLAGFCVVTGRGTGRAEHSNSTKNIRLGEGDTRFWRKKEKRNHNRLLLFDVWDVCDSRS